MPPKNNIQLGAGTLYIKKDDGELEPMGEITEIEELEFAEDAEPVVRIKGTEGAELCAELHINPVREIVHKLVMHYIEGTLRACPNRRVVHLVKQGKNARTRLKNWRRAQKLAAKEAKT